MQTYYSWYKDDDLSNMFDFYKKGYDFPILREIDIPVDVIVGENDEFVFMKSLNKDLDEIKGIFLKNVKDCDFKVVNVARHSYEGVEDKVGKVVVESI